jgi:hypothetical protein
MILEILLNNDAYFLSRRTLRWAIFGIAPIINPSKAPASANPRTYEVQAS